MNNKNSFFNLTPDLILNAAEKNGFYVTGEMTQLNSYENRVFDIKLEACMKQELDCIKQELEDKSSIIAKFYRPNRWSQKTLLDEHHFIQELKNDSIEVAGTLQLKNNSTLDSVDGIYYAFFEKVRGRLLHELNSTHFKKLGRWLARLHNVGSKSQAKHRNTLGPTNDHKWEQLETLLMQVSPEVATRYEEAAVQIFERLDEQLNDLNPSETIRLHGDLHRGNILENSDSQFVIVDFDDMINGPAIQDFWMLMPNADVNDPDFNLLIESYSELRTFPHHQLDLIPLLRGYRIITYALWILNRWSDPSFPRLFPNFNSYNYWAEEAESLTKISHSL